METFGIECEQFRPMRENLDKMLNVVFNRMREMGQTGCKIGLRLNIETATEETASGEIATVPRIEYKMTCQMETKGEFKGDVTTGEDVLMRRGDGFVIVDRKTAMNEKDLLDMIEEV